MSGPMALFSPNYTGQWTRLLRHGDVGHEVAAWQFVMMEGGVRVKLDEAGIFGDLTHNATMAWQMSRNLEPDGIVGPKTRREIGTCPFVSRTSKLVYLAIKNAEFIEAENWSKWIPKRKVIDCVVIHCMEGSESSTRAERCAKWIAGLNSRFPAPRASAHYCVDSDSIVQCVSEEHVAWHAPGANRYGIGIEHAGFSRQTIDEWLDPFGRSMLNLSAALTADICKRWDIPMQFISSEDLLLDRRGITTHCEVTKAFGRSTHMDPGENFPMELYTRMVRDHAKARGIGK